MSRDGDLRRYVREAKSSPIQIVWKDSAGSAVFGNGRTLDISTSGARIEVPEPVEKQTYVTMQCSALGLQGTASVRSCTRKGMKYVLGLEFSGGLKWRPKTEA